ncbi:hypothetical protein GCM10010140_55120 [Streptosporangium pseudovulgare]|uniref:Uncharacterized protein n=1 Tax=Streptosporangium pseudovulgare TaxID=35765 RepID=A0ABQ2RA27_9ACTN|nr:hypothetical protein GCM10010140_55120 [Streptosporangium pseudovulgare]
MADRITDPWGPRTPYGPPSAAGRLAAPAAVPRVPAQTDRRAAPRAGDRTAGAGVHVAGAGGHTGRADLTRRDTEEA